MRWNSVIQLDPVIMLSCLVRKHSETRCLKEIASLLPSGISLRNLTDRLTQRQADYPASMGLDDGD